jgi:hypothetical protein
MIKHKRIDCRAEINKYKVAEPNLLILDLIFKDELFVFIGSHDAGGGRTHKGSGEPTKGLEWPNHL